MTFSKGLLALAATALLLGVSKACFAIDAPQRPVFALIVLYCGKPAGLVVHAEPGKPVLHVFDSTMPLEEFVLALAADNVPLTLWELDPRCVKS